MPPADRDPSRAALASPLGAVLQGAWRFALVSVIAFGVWAFAGRWFRDLGEGVLFAATAVVFVVLAGIVLAPLAPGPDRASRVSRVYRTFVPAFLVYAIVWSASWFLLRSHFGEWLASLLGSIAFVGVACSLLGDLRPFAKASVVFFVAHSIGYFAGGAVAYALFRLAQDGGLAGLSPAALAAAGKLAWGLLYGLGFGAGLGYAFWACRPRS